MTKKIVVTGASGFIGRNVVAALNARGFDDLLLVDTLGTDDKWRNLRGLLFEDLIHPSEFLCQLEKGTVPELDAILHLGACSSTTERDADYLLENNYAFSRKLCAWSLENNARFIYASSAATYGDGKHGYSDELAGLSLLRPLNMYGYSKHMLDMWVEKHRLFDRVVGLKYFNVYGPFEEHKRDMRSMVNKAYRQIKLSGRVQLFRSHRPEYADGEQMRDFIYVKDAVAVTLYFLENRAVSGLFNCGTGQARSWKDLMHATFTAMDVNPYIQFIEMPESIRENYQYFTQADVSKLRNAGYRMPFTSLEDAVHDYVTTHLSKTKE